MIIVRIVGGLGNQMFQYAYAKALQQKGYSVEIDISKFKKYKLHGGYQLEKYKIDIDTSSPLSNFLSKLGVRKNVKEKSLFFNKNFLNLPKNKYVKGYFQTEKYFSDIRPVLLNQFVIKKELSESTVLYSKEINKHQNSCSLHIRRGDYISDKKANSVHGTCDLNYYKDAIKLMNEKFKETQFFVFSDDISWTKNNLKIENAIYIDHKSTPHEDLFLMSFCKHNITANSSFSWWGAWLNQNENKTIIAPKKWFTYKENEVACENWTKL
jgi:hypothetical protein